MGEISKTGSWHFKNFSLNEKINYKLCDIYYGKKILKKLGKRDKTKDEKLLNAVGIWTQHSFISKNAEQSLLTCL